MAARGRVRYPLDMPTSKKLTRNDTAWFHMDSSTNLMVVSGFFRFDKPVDRARLEAALREGFLRFDRFRQRVEDKPGLFGRPRWVDDPDFHLDRHLTEETLPSPGDETALRAAIEARLDSPLPDDRPLWEMRLYQGFGQGSAVLFRIHHCIADGIALLQVLLGSCEPVDGAERPAPISKPKRPWYWWALLPLTATLWGLNYLWVSTWLVVRPRDPKTIYKGDLSGKKHIAWTGSFPLADVKALSRAAGCKINDLLMTVAAGALHRYAAERDQPPVKGVRAMVPVNLRSAKAAGELGNKFAVVSPTLPLGALPPDERLGIVKQRMDRLKRSPEPLSTVALMNLFGYVGTRAQHRIQRFLVNKATLVITNVPGPRKKLAMAGVPIEQLMFWVPMFGPTGLGVSIFTYADEVSLGVLADEALGCDPRLLADALVSELDVLRAHYGLSKHAVEDVRPAAA